MSDMRKMHDRLHDYFMEGISAKYSDSIGMEVETPFVDSGGAPITLETSQSVFRGLVETGWQVVQRKGPLLAEIRDAAGNRVLYELGRQNIELATRPMKSSEIIGGCRNTLGGIYAVAEHVGAYPRFEPILDSDEDLLVVPDERDATWIDLDGREALKPLAKISAVQFTIEVPHHRAIECVNNLNKNLLTFMGGYPQDRFWRRYIRDSNARYENSRYGGPEVFNDMDDYCWNLGAHRIVTKDGLKDYSYAGEVDLNLFIRSVWWYFRLRRYGDRLCVEVRPLARWTDAKFEQQLAFVLGTLHL